MKQAEQLYRTMIEIRLFEERLLQLFSTGQLSGTTHTCIGQEANAVAVMENIGVSDVVFSNHRCHGHFLARFGDSKALLAEIMGRSTGVCGGRGGSQHLCRDNFFSNGTQGGFLPISVGIALAEKEMKTGAIAIAFIGDGTLGEGSVYEALNMASLWNVPLLVIIENNRIAQTTPLDIHLSGSITARVRAFGIGTHEIESTNVFELLPIVANIISNVRLSQKPYVLVIHTNRLSAHSKGDDSRDPAEIEQLQERDPLLHFIDKISAEKRTSIRQELLKKLKAIESEVAQAPFAGPD